MIVHTETGSIYEIDEENRRARKTCGVPTEMTSGGGWRNYVTAELVGARLCIVWDAPGVIKGNRATVTSPIVRVEWPVEAACNSAFIRGY